MKTFRPLLAAVLLLGFLFVLPVRSAAQQARPANALGIRFTGGIGLQDGSDFNEYPSFGAELSYQRFLTPRTRLEADFGMRFYDYNPETNTVHWMDSNMRGHKRNGIRYGIVQYDREISIEWWARAFCHKKRGATLYRLRDDIVFADSVSAE